MTDADRASLIALETLRRQVGGLPGEFYRLWQDIKVLDKASGDAPAPTRGLADRTSIRLDGFDTMLANMHNRLAVQGWPKIMQLVNMLLVHVQQRASGALGAGGPGALGAGGGGRPPRALGAYDGRYDSSRVDRQGTDRAWLDIARLRILALRRAAGRATSSAFRRATTAAGRATAPVKSLWSRVKNSRWGTRVGYRFNLEKNSKGAAAIGRGAKAVASGVGGAAKGVGGALMAAMSPFMLKLIAVLGPLALLAAVLSSASSGFSLVTTSVKLLAMTLGPILLPFMVLLATGIASMSDIIWNKMMPQLEKWFTLILVSGIPALERFLLKVEALATAIEWVVNKIPGAGAITQHAAPGGSASPSSFLDSVMGFGADSLIKGGGVTAAETIMMSLFGRKTPPSDPRPDSTTSGARAARGDVSAAAGAAGAAGAARGGSNAAPGAPGGISTTDDRMNLIKSNMNMVLAEMKFQQGPRASFSGLRQASSNAQMAALNKSPFEAQMLARMTEIIARMDRSIGNATQNIPTPRHEGAK